MTDVPHVHGEHACNICLSSPAVAPRVRRDGSVESFDGGRPSSESPRELVGAAIQHLTMYLTGDRSATHLEEAFQRVGMAIASVNGEL